MLKHIFRKLNIFIACFGILFTVIYYINFGDALSPILFTLLAMALSSVYSYNGNAEAKKAKIGGKKLPPQIRDNADICVEEINKNVKSIMATAKEKKDMLLVTSFFRNIDEIDETVNRFYENCYMMGTVLTF